MRNETTRHFTKVAYFMHFKYEVTKTQLRHNIRPRSFRVLAVNAIKSDLRAKPIKQNVLYSGIFDYSPEF